MVERFCCLAEEELSKFVGKQRRQTRSIHPEAGGKILQKFRWLGFTVGVSFLTVLVGCSQPTTPTGPISLNSRYTDEQPALSGDGRFMALVSNRNGNRNILFYDVQRQQFLNLPRLNRGDAIAESPSLSYTGRYIVYLASDRARPEIELYDRFTQQIQVLTVGYRGWIRNPSISPDGRYIAFESGVRGQWDIEVIDRGPNVELDLPDARRIRPSPIPSPR